MGSGYYVKPGGRRESLSHADSGYYHISMQPLSYIELLRAWPASASWSPGANARSWLAGDLALKDRYSKAIQPDTGPTTGYPERYRTSIYSIDELIPPFVAGMDRFS